MKKPADHPALKELTETVPEYTEFAIRLRYDDLPWVTRDEAERALRPFLSGN